jgi:hypothetical protein
MTQETYRFAYEEASAELRDILGQFQALAARKEQMEQVVEALKVVLAEECLPEPSIVAEQAPFLVHQSVEHQEPAPEPEPEPAFAESSDPFQRRIDMALRLGLETRVLPRALNGLLSRA